MIGSLPTTLAVDGVEYDINSDFRAALIIFEAYGSSNLSALNKQLTMLEIIYTPIGEDKPTVPPNLNEATRQALWFLDAGRDHRNNRNAHVKTIDYKQDEQLLFSAVNAVFARDIREEIYLHWWTFYSLCQAIDSESSIAQISSLRYKRATGEKLDKCEQRFYRENQHLIDFKTSADDYEAMARQLRGG